MWNVLIVDDEQPARDRLRRLLDPMSDYSAVGEARNGVEALEQIRELNPDIVLLDISMPGMDGMALAQTLQDSGAAPAIVFCTAYQDQALSAFEVEAVDYVVKRRAVTWAARKRGRKSNISCARRSAARWF
jgi:two-component system response regulator AlgR